MSHSRTLSGMCSEPKALSQATCWKRLLGVDVNSREPSEEVTAVVTGSDGSWTRVVAMEIETDCEGGADSIC